MDDINLEGKILIAKKMKDIKFENAEDENRYQINYYDGERKFAFGKIKADLIIDNLSILNNALYSHYGNELRDNSQSFIISNDENAFSDVKSGDFMEINMSNLGYITKNKKQPFISIAKTR